MLTHVFENMVTVILGAICVLTFGLGCGKEQNRVPAVQVNGDMLLRVIEEAFRNGGWKTASEVVVKRDGDYQWRFMNESNAAIAIIEGHLPPPLVRVLQEDVLRKEGFRVIKEVPTYEYGVDNNHVRHPPGIGQLLEFIRKEGLKTGKIPY